MRVFVHLCLDSELGSLVFRSLRSSPQKNHLGVLPGIAIPRCHQCRQLRFLTSPSSPGCSQLHPGGSLNSQPLSSPCRLPWQGLTA